VKKRIDHLQPAFVEEVPETLQPGLLYVSVTYGTVVHSCCCGCGEEVVTPLTPTDWRMIYDGESISLTPSVGSWSLPCQSHYVVDRGKIRWAGSWTKAQIERQWARDRAAKAAYYGEPLLASQQVELAQDRELLPVRPSHKQSKFKAALKWLFGSFGD